LKPLSLQMCRWDMRYGVWRWHIILDGWSLLLVFRDGDDDDDDLSKWEKKYRFSIIMFSKSIAYVKNNFIVKTVTNFLITRACDRTRKITCEFLKQKFTASGLLTIWYVRISHLSDYNSQ
jgi:hypothetical protein